MSATHPKLSRHARLRWDARDGAHILLYPERGLVLNASAAAIVKLCDGRHTEDEIALSLARETNASIGVIARDVHALLERLRDRRVVE